MAQKKKVVVAKAVVNLAEEAGVVEPVDSRSAFLFVKALDGDNWQSLAKRYLPVGKSRNVYAAELWLLNGRRAVVAGMDVKLG